MTIYTKYLGPTSTRGSRIKVWVYWHDRDRMEKTYPYSYTALDPHDAAVASFINEWTSLVTRHFRDDAQSYVLKNPPQGPWYVGESPDSRGNVYTNVRIGRLGLTD